MELEGQSRRNQLMRVQVHPSTHDPPPSTPVRATQHSTTASTPQEQSLEGREPEGVDETPNPDSQSAYETVLLFQLNPDSGTGRAVLLNWNLQCSFQHTLVPCPTVPSRVSDARVQGAGLLDSDL